MLASLCGSAAAQVYQTDAAQTPLPQPVSVGEYGLVTNIWAFNEGTQVNRDFDGNDITAQGLFLRRLLPGVRERGRHHAERSLQVPWGDARLRGERDDGAGLLLAHLWLSRTDSASRRRV
jgi:hypothetical protein